MPDIYREMLAEAGATPRAAAAAARRRRLLLQLQEQQQQQEGLPPKKRGPPGARAAQIREVAARGRVGAGGGKVDGRGEEEEEEEDDDEGVEFEDVVLPPPPTVQTLEREDGDEDDSDEDSDSDGGGGNEAQAPRPEDVDPTMFGPGLASTGGEPDGSDAPLQLDLAAHKAATAAATPRSADRRKPLTRAEKEARVDVHKVHVVCLVAHAALRNAWCNDAQTQATLRRLLTDKNVAYLNPSPNLSQFGRTESLKNGLNQVAAMWRQRFHITERGTRRALWAEKPEHLATVGAFFRLDLLFA